MIEQWFIVNQILFHQTASKFSFTIHLGQHEISKMKIIC